MTASANGTERATLAIAGDLEEFNKAAKLLARYGFSLATLNRQVKAGTFPPPLYFGAHRRWKREDLLEWEAARPRGGAPAAVGSDSAIGGSSGGGR